MRAVVAARGNATFEDLADFASRVDPKQLNRMQLENLARAGAIEMANMLDWKGSGTGLWTRVNPLNSPWFLDDVTEIVTKAGNVYDVIMLPKVEGPWDIHYADQLVAQLEAKAGISRPILFHAILETGQGVALVEEICLASPRMQGISLGPADLAANRAMKTTRVGGGHPMYKVIEDPHADAAAPRAAAQQDPWHYTLGKMVDACVQAGIKPFYGPFGDIADLAASFQQAACDCLTDRTARAIAAFPEATALVVAGGVAANQAIRATLAGLAATHGLPFVAPQMWLCTDNGAMIAWAGLERLAIGDVDDLHAPARPRWPLDPAAEAVRGAGVKA